MTTVDATAGESGRPATVSEAPAAAPVVGPMAGDPGMLGLGSFIVGSVALGLGLVGVVPVGVVGLRARDRAAEARRLRRAGVRRPRDVPLLRRRLRGHRREGAFPPQAPDEIGRGGRDLYFERGVGTAPGRGEPPWPVGVPRAGASSPAWSYPASAARISTSGPWPCVAAADGPRSPSAAWAPAVSAAWQRPARRPARRRPAVTRRRRPGG